MEPGTGSRTGAGDISGVLMDLGADQNNIEHDTAFPRSATPACSISL